MHDLCLLIVPPEHRQELASMCEAHRGFKMDIYQAERDWPATRIQAASYGLDTCMAVVSAVRYHQPSRIHAHAEHLKTRNAFFVGSHFSQFEGSPYGFDLAPATGKVLDIPNREIPRAPMTPAAVTAIQRRINRDIVLLRGVRDDLQQALETPNTAKILGGVGPYQQRYIVSVDQGDPVTFRQWSAYHLARNPETEICLVWV